MNEKVSSRNIRIRKPEQQPVINLDEIVAGIISPLQVAILDLQRENKTLREAVQLIANGLSDMANSVAIVSSSSGSTKLLLEEALFHINGSIHSMSRALENIGLFVDADLIMRFYSSPPEAETEEDRHIRNVSDM
jgi:hypothetical protein